VSVLIFFLTACATTPPTEPLATGDFTEEKIASEFKYGDDILVFHKTQGPIPIRFARVNQEYLFFFDIDETQNLYSVMDGKIHLKDIDRIEIIKRSDFPTGTSLSPQAKKWVGAGAGLLVLIIIIPLMFIAAL
jgi:hypothetical protein